MPRWSGYGSDRRARAASSRLVIAAPAGDGTTWAWSAGPVYNAGAGTVTATVVTLSTVPANYSTRVDVLVGGSFAPGGGLGTPVAGPNQTISVNLAVSGSPTVRVVLIDAQSQGTIVLLWP